MTNTPARQILPGGVLGFLARRWYLIVLPILLMPALSYLKVLGEPETYRSRAQLLVRESNLRSPLLDSYVLNIDLETQLDTLGKMARQAILLEKVGAVVAAADSTGRGPTVGGLKEALEIHIAADGGMSLSATAGTPQEARRLLEAYQEVCIEELNRPRVEAAEKMLRFLEAELETAKENLTVSHLHLSDYRASHGKVLPELEAITYNLLLSLEAEQVQLESQAHALAEKRTQLEAHPSVRGKTPAGLREQISRLEGDLAAQAEKMTESHPELQIMRARLARLKQDLALREKGLTPPGSKGDPSRAEEDYNLLLIEQGALQERLAQVKGRVAELQVKIASASNHDAEYVRRLRDVESHTELYLDLLRRHERAATSRHLVQTNHGDLVRILQPASLPEIPDSPGAFMEILLGLVTGILVGGGLAFGAEMTDARIYGPRNLEFALGAPTLLVLDDNR